MIYKLHGRHIDLSKLVSVTDVRFGNHTLHGGGMQCSYEMQFQLMDKSIDRIFPLVYNRDYKIIDGDPMAEGIDGTMINLHPSHYRGERLKFTQKIQDEINEMIEQWKKLTQ